MEKPTKRKFSNSVSSAKVVGDSPSISDPFGMFI